MEVRGLEGLKGLDAESLYQDKFEKWKQDPAKLNPNLQSDIKKSSNNLVDNLIKNKDQNSYNLGKSFIKGVAGIGKKIGDFAIDTGIYKDFNPDRNITEKDEDGKRIVHVGDAIGNLAGNFGKGLAAASAFIPQAKMAENVNNKAAQSIAQSVGMFATKSGNPWLTLYGGALLAGQRLGINNSGSYTGNKLVDIGNSALALVPGLGLLGKKAREYYEDPLVNSSFGYNNIGENARKNANGRFIIKGGDIDNEIGDANLKTFIASNNILKPERLNLISAQDPKYYIAAQNELSGGYNQVGAAKHGAVLQFTKRTISKSKIKKQQYGGQVIYTTKEPETHLTGSRTLDELVDYVEQKNPPFWSRMSGQDKNYIANDDGSVSSLRMTYSDNGHSPYAEVYPMVQYDLNGNLKYYSNPQEAYEMAKLRNDIIRMTKEEAELFTTQYKQSSKLKNYYDNYNPPSKDPEIEYNSITLNGTAPLKFPPEWMKEGGKVNVIPEGALHKNKHNLDKIDKDKFGDSITTKGIPVVSEDEKGNIIQQAEVEKEEIIFRLEVTKKLEELSKKHTDEAAIEAGKLLVHEILYNTEDKTNNMI